MAASATAQRAAPFPGAAKQAIFARLLAMALRQPPMAPAIINCFASIMSANLTRDMIGLPE